MTENVTNEHLRKEMDNLEKNDELGNLLEEFMHSRLIVPMDDRNEGCAMAELDDEIYIPLFTDIHEYNKVRFDERFHPEVFDFNFYLELLKEGPDGFVVNVESERFPITKKFLEFMDADYTFDLDYQPFTMKEIRRIHGSIDNARLKEFLEVEANRWDFESLMDVLFDSDLLSLVVSRDDLDCYLENDVIPRSSVDELTYFRTRDNHAVLFSSKDIDVTLDGHHLYSILVNLGMFIDFVLKRDIDGIILDDDIVIPRDFLIGFMKDFSNPCIDKFDDYIFKSKS